MTRTVLIPVDGSENSQRAFDFYVSNIRHADDMILLCHVQQTPSLSVVSMHQPLQVPVDVWTAQLQEAMKKSEKVVTHYQIACEEAKMAKKVLIGTGNPGEEIIAQASNNHADLIVMGSRGLNAMRRTFTGSVSDYVIHHAHIPVTVVPPK